jgi:hypothetical protein
VKVSFKKKLLSSSEEVNMGRGNFLDWKRGCSPRVSRVRVREEKRAEMAKS